MSSLDAPIFLILAVAGAAIAGADRIDEDEIRHVEPCARIVDEPRWRTFDLAVVVGLDHARADAAEMEIGRGRARAAVEDEGDGALGVEGIARIGDIEDVGRTLAVAAGEGDGPGFGRVAEQLAVDRDGVMGDRWVQAACLPPAWHPPRRQVLPPWTCRCPAWRRAVAFAAIGGWPLGRSCAMAGTARSASMAASWSQRGRREVLVKWPGFLVRAHAMGLGPTLRRRQGPAQGSLRLSLGNDPLGGALV